MNQNEFVSISRLGQHLNVANNTIKRWYDWYESELNDTDLYLPRYYHLDARCTRFFRSEDIPAIDDFKMAINKGGSHYGCMADFNKKHWPKKEN